MKKIFTTLMICILFGSTQAQSLRRTIGEYGSQDNLNRAHANQNNQNGNYAHRMHHQSTEKAFNHGSHCYIGMSSEAFNVALRMIENQSFDSRKLELANQIVAKNYMNTSQIKSIATLFSFDSYRLQFVKNAYDHCLNQGEYFMLYEVFTFNSYARELATYIGYH